MLDPDEIVDEYGRTRQLRKIFWEWKARRRIMGGASMNWPDGSCRPSSYADWPWWPKRPGTGGGAGTGQAEGG